MTWTSDRKIEQEIQDKIEEHQNSEEIWKPWGPLDWPDDYGEFEYYADRLKNQSKYGALTQLRSSRTALIEFKAETEYIDSLQELNNYTAEKFANWLVNEKGIAESTRDGYISVLDGLGEFYSEADHFDGNPFSDVELIDDDEQNSTGFLENNRVDIPKTTIVKKIDDYGVKNENTVIIITLAKTGIRISELCNLNDSDLNLSNKVGNELIEPRPELQGKPDTLYVDENVERESLDDDTDGNKRKVGTEIPIDNELKQLLTWYLLARPGNFSESDETPLFRSIDGSRFSSSTASARVTTWSKEVGLHGNDDEMNNVTAHWFRSFFTTEMYESTDSDELNGMSVIHFVKGLRGDVGADVIWEYIQGDREFHKIVTNNTPKFGL